MPEKCISCCTKFHCGEKAKVTFGFHPTFLTLDIAQTSLALFSLNRKVAIKGGGR